MTTVIRDTIIATCDPDGRILYDGAIAIDDNGIIAAVGPSDEVVRAYPTADMVSGRGKAVYPGFFNCHTHLTATLSRGILEDLGFPSPLRFPEQIAAMLSAEEMQVMALLGAIEGIRSGTTTFFEQGRGISNYAQQLADTGARFVLTESMTDVTYNVISAGTLLKSSADFSEELAEAAYQRAVDVYDSWHGKADGRLTVYFSPSTTDSVSPAMLRRSRELAEERGVGYTIHLSQSKQEVAGVMAAWGVLPAHYLEQNEFLGPRLVVAHCREIVESEIRALGRHGTGVSNNPAIAARRGAAAPALDLEEAGCRIGIGTDNMAEDMVEAIRTGYFVERVRRDDPFSPTPEKMLEWGTIGGARIMGMDETLGSLEVGKQADLFVTDLRRAHMVPVLRLVSDFVNNGQASDVEAVMVAGNWVMRDHKLLHIDEDDILARGEEIAHRAWRQLREKYPDVPMPFPLMEGPAF